MWLSIRAQNMNVLFLRKKRSYTFLQFSFIPSSIHRKTLRFLIFHSFWVSSQSKERFYLDTNTFLGFFEPMHTNASVLIFAIFLVKIAFLSSWCFALQSFYTYEVSRSDPVKHAQFGCHTGPFILHPLF